MQRFYQYSQDIFLAKGTGRVGIKPYGNLLPTLFMYCFGTCDFVDTLFSKTVHILLTTLSGYVCCKENLD